MWPNSRLWYNYFMKLVSLTYGSSKGIVLSYVVVLPSSTLINFEGCKILYFKAWNVLLMLNIVLIISEIFMPHLENKQKTDNRLLILLTFHTQLFVFFFAWLNATLPENSGLNKFPGPWQSPSNIVVNRWPSILYETPSREYIGSGHALTCNWSVFY